MQIFKIIVIIIAGGFIVYVVGLKVLLWFSSRWLRKTLLKQKEEYPEDAEKIDEFIAWMDEEEGKMK